MYDTQFSYLTTIEIILARRSNIIQNAKQFK